jgi:hypothetical protein
MRQIGFSGSLRRQTVISRKPALSPDTEYLDLRVGNDYTTCLTGSKLAWACQSGHQKAAKLAIERI